MTNVVEHLFLVLLCLLCIFGDMSVKIFCPPFKKSVCFSSPLCILNASLLIGVRIYKCFLTVCGLFFFFFYFLNMSVWRRQWHPTPVLLPGKSHGRRSLVGFSPWGSWVGHDWATSLWLFTFMHWRRKWQPTPVFLPGESQGREPGRLPSMGSHRVRHNLSDLATCL